jgi:hypothetical protein
MSTTKFGKYFTTDVLHESPKFPGLWDVSSTRHLTGFGGGHLSVDCILITRAFTMVSRPHRHEFPQYLHFFSANPLLVRSSTSSWIWKAKPIASVKLPNRSTVSPLASHKTAAIFRRHPRQCACFVSAHLQVIVFAYNVCVR